MAQFKVKGWARTGMPPAWRIRAMARSGGKAKFLHVSRCAFGQVFLKGLVQVLDGPDLQHGLGDVRPADLSPGKGQDLVIGNGNAQLLQAKNDFRVSFAAGLLEAFQFLLEDGGGVIDKISEDMHAATGIVGADFQTRDQFKMTSLGRPQGLRQTGHRIMVGEGDGGRSLLDGISHQFSGGQAAVRGIGMGVQIDEVHKGSLKGYYENFYYGTSNEGWQVFFEMGR